ncbi:MAG TPA: EVE domain-containing protein [Steroidobacteraceae bacterium]|nr:EVE domain-containing protein [Steroidobacteraceae bacterium]
MKYWLMKTEPTTFGIDDLAKAPRRRSHWDGVRNYQVRNMIRDEMQKGDLAFFYHSSCAVPGIYGVARIARAGYPDPTAFDRRHAHFDPKSDPAAPTWYMVDVELVRRFAAPVTLEKLKANARALEDLLVLRRGNRLSIMPVTATQWRKVLALA